MQHMDECIGKSFYRIVLANPTHHRTVASNTCNVKRKGSETENQVDCDHVWLEPSGHQTFEKMPTPRWKRIRREAKTDIILSRWGELHERLYLRKDLMQMQ